MRRPREDPEILESGSRCLLCGGPEFWTIHAGDVWSCCARDCQPSFFAGRLGPPPDGDVLEAELRLIDEMELSDGGG